MEFGKPGEFLTDRLTDEAIHVIDQAGDRPFFLYLAHYAPHTPIEAKPDDLAHFQTKLQPNLRHQNAVYAAMVKNLDDNVGRLIRRLQDRDLSENTIVVFVSDNGGYIGVDRGQSAPVTDNAPLRSGKGSLYEGGVRVPLIIRWPKVAAAGGVCRHPVTLMDLFHTLTPLTDPQPTPTSPGFDAGSSKDGVNLTPMLQDPSAALPPRDLYFHYPHYYPTTTPVSAIRRGDWKLLEYFEDGRTELYDLRSDISESRDVSAEKTEQTSELLHSLQQWRAAVGAELPKRK